MPSAELLREADRQTTVCNACRYCEGLCAVFPAMERRRAFTGADLIYLANLCFDCRACYYACPYTPPHEYAINFPEVLAAVRVETYRDFSAPRLVARLFQGSKKLAAFTIVAVVALVFALVLALRGPSALTPGRSANFFDVIPYWTMSLPMIALSGYAVVVMLAGGARYWRETSGSLRQLISPGAFLRATGDAFGLAYLDGGDAGCPYPDELPSMSRRWAHHLVFYGFLLDFASTTVAFFYHNFLHREPPYALLSPPVVLGTVGGVMLVAGVLALLTLKARSDREMAQQSMLNLDVVFLGLLLATAVTGLVLLIGRESAAMGTLLVVHLGIVAGLFLTLPYGKFAHVVYRYAALVKNQIELRSTEHAG